MKRFLEAALLIVVVIAALSAQQKSSKATCSLSIRLLQTSVKAGSPFEVDVAKTNTSHYVLNNSRATNPGENYIFDVRRNGVPAAESKILRRLTKPGSSGPEEKLQGIAGRYKTSYIFEDLQPHQTFEETISVSEYYDMAQPGEYTIQLQQGKVKSNIVTVTVVP